MLLKKIARSAGRTADMGRATVLDLPVLLISVGVLYGMAFVDDGWDPMDGVIVVIIALTMMRVGVAQRWS